MNKNIKSFIAIILSFGVLVAFTGCSKFKSSQIALVTLPSGEKSSVSVNDYMYEAYMNQSAGQLAILNQLSQSASSGQTAPPSIQQALSETSNDGVKTWRQVLNDSIKKSVEENYILLDKFKEAKLTLSTADKKTVNDTYTSMSTSLTPAIMTKLRAELKVTETQFKIFIENQIKITKFFNSLFDVGGKYELKEADVKKEFDTGYARVKHILLKTSTQDAQGQSVPFDEAKLKEIETKANALLAKAKNGEDFELLAKFNSEDGEGPKPETDKEPIVPKIELSQDGKQIIENYGYIFPKGAMVKEFEDTSFKLKVGEIEMAKTTYGYHIIKKYDINENPEYYTKLKDGIKNNIKQTKFTPLLEDWKKKYTFTFDTKKLAKYDLVNLKDVTA